MLPLCFSFFPSAFLPKCLLLKVRASSSMALANWLPGNVTFLKWMINQLWNDVNNWTGSFLLYFQLLQKRTMTRCVVEKASALSELLVKSWLVTLISECVAGVAFPADCSSSSCATGEPGKWET